MQTKASCSSCWELLNSMSHTFYSQVSQVDSWLFMVGIQIGNLTLDLSFGHNLCFTCPNEQCEPILNIQELFNDIKNVTSYWVLTPEIVLWSFRNPLRLHLPEWELPWECEGSFPHTPSHFLTLLGVCDVTLGLLFGSHPCDLFALTPGLLFGPQPCNPFALVASPKLRLRQISNAHFVIHHVQLVNLTLNKKLSSFLAILCPSFCIYD
jgi:hypothetical protein